MEGGRRQNRPPAGVELAFDNGELDSPDQAVNRPVWGGGGSDGSNDRNWESGPAGSRGSSEIWPAAAGANHRTHVAFSSAEEITSRTALGILLYEVITF
jgi:hypothetical protein